MAPRLTLTLPPAFGSRKVQVDSKRFSIGRTPENDLVLEDSSLSRRHALIENYDGVFNLSDCGSSNGTLINGMEVTGARELRDRDVLTFGGVGNVVVGLDDDQTTGLPPSQPATATPQSYPGVSQQAAAGSDSDSGLSCLSPPVIAISAAVLIILVAGLVLVLTQTGGNSRRASKSGLTRRSATPVENTEVPNQATPTQSESPADPSPSSEVPAGPTNTDTHDFSVLEAAASKVLSGISKDTHPVLTEPRLKEIDGQIQRYRNSPGALRDQLRALKQNSAGIAALAKSKGLKPALLAYAALAEIDRNGGRGDPAAVAGQIGPELARMSKIFGDELANDSLLAVAALDEGAALQGRITRLASRVTDSPTTIRSIWYLHEHQTISDATYAFVMRFIAIGAIAQNPQAFGIAAEPVTF
jgi:pSer/pThr/pTyr-binding forkhead associated (FHA) protein